MAIPIPFGSKHIATFAVQAWIPVRCQHCSHTFAYVTEKRVTGEGFSLLGLDEKGASERAKTRAAVDAHITLEAAADAVPCRQCGRLQAAMVRSIQRSRRRAGWGVGIVTAGAWLIWAMVAVSSSGDEFWATATSWPPALAGLATIAAVVAGYAAAHNLTTASDAHHRSQVRALTEPEFDAISEVGYLLIPSIAFPPASADIPTLRDGLHSFDSEIRMHCATVLGDRSAESASALPDLELLLKDPNRAVRMRAKWAVETIRDKNSG